MRSFLHEIHPARSDLLIVWLGLIAFLVGSCTARGGESESRAILALAKAKREREAIGCHTDALAARLEAVRTNRPLVYWVNVTCAEHAQLRRELHEAVHCHQTTWKNDRTPRIVFFDEDGNEFSLSRDMLGAGSARKIRAKWPGVALMRSGVGVSEN